jgi:hypothetical protein
MNREESLWREPAKDIAPQQQQVGYPRVVGPYVAGYGEPGYAPGTGMGAVYGAPPPPMLPHPGGQHGHYMHGHPVHSPAWRPMNAPGNPPLGEGHVFLPLNPETFSLSTGGGAIWGSPAGGGGAPPGTVITFSARPQKPFKMARLIVRKGGPNAAGANVIGQAFVGTDLQQGELGFVDIESIGAGGSFDTWISFKQAEPGVWIRLQVTLTAFPLSTTGTDFVTVTCSGLGHYLH